MIAQSPRLISLKSIANSAWENQPCDCACPDDKIDFCLVQEPYSPLLVQPELFSAALSEDYTLLFNPFFGQAAVLNRAARQVWETFSCTALPGELQPDSLVQEMRKLGLLVPADAQYIFQQSEPKRLTAWLQITNRCNLRCSYCYVEKTNETMSLEVGLAAIQGVLRSALLGGFNSVYLKYAGGEPSLNLPLVFALHDQAIQQAAQLGLSFKDVLLTNGTNLSSQSIEGLARREIQVMVSCDGLGEAQDLQRRFPNGRGTSRQVLSTLHNLLEAGITPFVSITLTNANAPYLAETVRYMLALGLPFNFNFNRPEQAGDLLVADIAIPAIRDAFMVIAEQPPSYNLLNLLLDRTQPGSPHAKACIACDSYLAVDPLGRIAKCHMQFSQPVAHIHIADPLAALKASRLGLENPVVDQRAGCQVCSWRYACAGGCPLLTQRINERTNDRSPYCEMYQALFPDLIKLEGLRLIHYGHSNQ